MMTEHVIKSPQGRLTRIGGFLKTPLVAPTNLEQFDPA